MSKEEKEKLVPNLRFKGFTDDWIQDKLQNISLINPPSTLPTDIKYVDLESVKGTSLINYQKISSDSAPSRAQRLAEKGDIFYQTVRPYQKNNYYFNKEDGDFVFSTGYAQIRVDKTDKKFVFYKLQDDRFVNEVMKKSTGTSYPAINTTDLSRILLNIPKSKCEQEKIGNVLKKIDNIITLEQEKLTHYQAMKKALSTSIFPRNNESLPNLTFNGDSGWKQQKLENFLSIPDKIKVEVTDTDEILSVKLNTNGVVGGESRSTLKLGATAYYSRDSGQFIYGKQNFFNGAMAIIPENLDGKVSSGDIPSLNISGINPNFLYEYLSRPYYYKQTETMASGTGSKRIHEKTLLNFKIKVPNSNVQSNIEHLLASLSNLIDIQNNKVKKVEQVKAYLLNNLFV